MEALLEKRREIADQTLELTFSLWSPIHFYPGQYAKIKIPLLFPDKKDTRKFSIINSPHNNKEIVIAFRMSESGYKKTLASMTTRATVEIEKIKGDLILQENTTKPLVFIAGGIGITPFISMLDFMNETASMQKTTLFYFNKTLKSTAYFEKLHQLEKDKNFCTIFSMTQDFAWNGEHRKISPELLGENIIDKNSLFYVAGTPTMVQTAESVLKSWNVSAENIILEDFEGYK